MVGAARRQHTFLKPEELQATYAWYSSANRRAVDQPGRIKHLNLPQLEQLEERLRRWFRLFGNAPVAPAHRVSPLTTPVSTSGLHVSAQQAPVPPVQTASMPHAPVPAPAEHAAMHQAAPAAAPHVSVPAHPAAQATVPELNPHAPVFSPEHHSVAGEGRMKIPSPPFYKGDSANSNPASVRYWLRQMQLSLKQTRQSDPVSVAMTYLADQAANWRDTNCLMRFRGVASWEVFEQEFTKRFVSAASCVDSLKALRKLSQASGQSVQEYNELFRQGRLELQALPHITVPDNSTQAEIYLTGLRPAVAGVLKDKVDPARLTDLEHLMSLAEVAETIAKHMALIFDRKGQNQHATDKSHGVQKRKHEDACPGPSHKKGAAGKGKQSNQKGKGPGQSLVEELPQHRSHPKATGSPSFEGFRDLQALPRTCQKIHRRHVLSLAGAAGRLDGLRVISDNVTGSALHRNVIKLTRQGRVIW